MNFFDTVGGQHFIGKMERNVSSIEKSLATIATELKRSNDAAEEKIILPFKYLAKFAKSMVLGETIGCRQLRALWTSYCIVNNMQPDTQKYDAEIFSLWEIVQTDIWIGTSFDEFDEFMCEDLC